ncbi:MAG: PorT family protein [Culturomica sp.]|nr:PorT family protein [Culturomica sp.]
MKKILLIAVMAAIACGTYAQKVTWGVRGGLNLPKVAFDTEGEAPDYKAKTGFHLGVVADLEITGSFYLQPGLYLTTKGAQLEESEGQASYEQKVNLSYLQVPVLASYRFDLGDDLKLHLNAGPYLAYGVGGKIKEETKWQGGSEENKYDAFGTSGEDTEKGGLKRFDAGLSLGAGVSIGKIYAGLNYDLGLSNLAEEKEWGNETKIKNRSFNISVGYNF